MLHAQGSSVVQSGNDRLLGLVADYLADCSDTDRNLLRISVQLGIHRELYEAGQNPSTLIVSRARSRLIDCAGMQPHVAEKLVGIWLAAYGAEPAPVAPTHDLARRPGHVSPAPPVTSTTNIWSVLKLVLGFFAILLMAVGIVSRTVARHEKGRIDRP